MASEESNLEEDTAYDEEMPTVEADAVLAIDGAADEANDGDGDTQLTVAAGAASKPSFLDYLRSPIVDIVVGSNADATTLHAHQALIEQIPFFAEGGRLSGSSAQSISMPDEDLGTVASVLEYLYKGDYFPRLTAKHQVEFDPALPRPDEEGVALLRHARVYTLAKKLGLPELAELAHSKIHAVPSTARGEIAYARFVYSQTMPDDEKIRKPIAAFWATRSYALRYEVESDFRQLCLEFPQFGFDVLSLVFEQQEKRSARVEVPPSSQTSRKRARMSGVDIGK